ncbi:MAG: Omp28-related outer membrane protein [Saprospiraceae bacterium]|nr:Omp28-related outer membrane protein [Candidatus Vicinibacter proximus]
MKRNLLAICFCFSLLGLGAQNTFSDDVESYKVGDYVAKSSTYWTVWSGATGEGTQEDALITDENAKSGTKSIRFEAATTAGGPTDLVLPFGGEKNIGKLTYEMWIYVLSDQAAYFNFQAKATIGTTWALDNYFDGDGKFRATLGSSANGYLCEVDYAPETWVKYTLIADLTDNNWEVKLNDVTVAKFANPNNTIASIDIYPNYVTGTETRGNGSTFYIDDISYDYVPFVKPNLDATLLLIGYKPQFLADLNSAGTMQVRNLGNTAINSLEISYKLGNGATQVSTFNNLKIASLGFQVIDLPAVKYLAGQNELSVEITKVNGVADDNLSNNLKKSTLTGVVPAEFKKVVSEEATGTWCQWCPRGAVYMDSMARTYPEHFIGIAVHNQDTMTVPVYDRGLTSFPGFPGFPSVVNNRKTISDPLDLEAEFYSSIVEKTPVKLTNGATWNATTGDLNISVRADFLENLNGDYRFNLVITENGVKGTGAKFNQANTYSGGARGPMGGYEKLPNPVPASRMTYNHVARAILDGYDGISGFLPTKINSGSTYFITYSLNVPITWKEANLELVGLLLGPDGEIVNATQTTIAQAVANGLYTSVENPSPAPNVIKLAPNPAADYANIDLNLIDPTQVSIEIVDMLGQLVQSRNYGVLSGEMMIPVNTEAFENGSYLIKLKIGQNYQTRKLVVNH